MARRDDDYMLMQIELEDVHSQLQHTHFTQGMEAKFTGFLLIESTMNVPYDSQISAMTQVLSEMVAAVTSAVSPSMGDLTQWRDTRRSHRRRRSILVSIEPTAVARM